MAPVVLVAKVLPRCFASTDAEASLRLLNRKLTAALKRMPCVGILNPDHRLLDAMKAPKRHLFATDGHHLSAGEAIEELAEVFVRGLAKFYGAGILAPFSGAPASSAEMRSTLPNQAGRGWSLTRCEWDTATNSGKNNTYIFMKTHTQANQKPYYINQRLPCDRYCKHMYIVLSIVLNCNHLYVCNLHTYK
ncbi:uncharacterized protein LOC144132405 isoform X2 [Amblyomma americanum]